MSQKATTYARKSSAGLTEESLRLQKLICESASQTEMERQRERSMRAAAPRKAKKK